MSDTVDNLDTEQAEEAEEVELSEREQAFENYFGEQDAELAADDDDPDGTADEGSEEDAEDAEGGEGELDDEAGASEDEQADEPPPQGFSSWRELAHAAVRAYDAQRQQIAQAQQAPPQPSQPGALPGGLSEQAALPHSGDKQVARAARDLLGGDVESFKKRPQAIQAKAVERVDALTDRQIEFLEDPDAFLSKHQRNDGVLAQRIGQLEGVLASLLKERIASQHSDIFSDQGQATEFARLVQGGISHDEAALILRERAELRRLKGERQKTKARAKDLQAQTNARRGAQGRNRRRRGGRKGSIDVTSADASNPLGLMRRIQRMDRQGEL